MATLSQLAKNLRSGRQSKSRVKALQHSPQRKGVIYKLDIISPRKPNSARRKIAKVRILVNFKRIFCHIPGVGTHGLHIYSRVMVEGKGPKDSPGVNYSLIRGLEDFDELESINRKNRRSKFGVKQSQVLPDNF